MSDRRLYTEDLCFRRLLEARGCSGTTCPPRILPARDLDRLRHRRRLVHWHLNAVVTHRPHHLLFFLLPGIPTAQAHLSRLTNTLKTLVELNVQSWKGQDSDRQGINLVVLTMIPWRGALRLSDRCVVA